MKTLVYTLLIFIGFSCKSTSYTSFKTKTLRVKYRKINSIYIQKYPISSLTETNTVNTTPLLKDSKGNYIEPEIYFLENDYFEDLIHRKYYDEHQDEVNVPKDVFKLFKDSVEKIRPKKTTFKEINILSDTIKFRKKVMENENNAYSSYESYTLQEIIQHNYHYVVGWYNSKKNKYYEFDASHRDYHKQDHWLEFEINEKREIIYWKEIDMKLFIKNEHNTIKNL